MKKIATITAMLLCLSTQAQIANSGFENWTNNNADNWTVSSEFGITQSTDPNSGSYAMSIHNWYLYLNTTLEYRGNVSQYPTQFNGMYNYISQPFSAGTVNIVVLSTMGDTIINDMGYFGPMNDWTGFSVALTQDVVPTDPADSIFISFVNSTADCIGNEFECDFLSLDDLSLTFGTASLNPLDAIQMNVFPNPADDLVTIQFDETTGSKNVHIFILDMAGKIAAEQTSSGKETTINVQHLDPGTYFVKSIYQDGRVLHQQLIIQ
jgi:hypothetical protein